MASVHIRPAIVSDLDAVERLENTVFAGDRLSRRSLRYYIDAPTVRFLVLDEAQGLIGDAIVAFRRGSGIARLYSIAIDPAAAGRGLGRRLLAACEEAAGERKARALRLEVRSDNVAAIALYESAGYGRFGLYPDYYEDGAAAVRFEKSIVTPG